MPYETALLKLRERSRKPGVVREPRGIQKLITLHSTLFTGKGPYYGYMFFRESEKRGIERLVLVGHLAAF